MKITEIEVKNFLSFDHMLLHLNSVPTLIIGQNNDSDALDSNGSGKSAIFESIAWGLFGKTFRNLIGDGVVNSISEKNCMVRLQLDVDDSKVEVIRYRKHKTYENKLLVKIDGVEQQRVTNSEMQNLVEEVIGMDFRTFLSTVAFPQGSFKYFASMTDSERKDLLEDVIGLQSFDPLLASVRKKLSDIDDECNQLKTSLQVDEERLKSERLNLSTLESKEFAFEKRKKEDLEEVSKCITQLRGDLKKMRNTYEKLNLDDKVNEIKRQEIALKNLEVDERRYIDVSNAIATAQSRIESLDEEILRLEKELDKRSHLKTGKKCPVVGRVIIKDVEIHSQEISQDIKRRKGIRQSIHHELSSHREEERRLRIQREAYGKVLREIERNKKEVEDLRKKKLELVSPKEKLKAQLETMKTKQKEIQERKSPYVELIEKSKKTITQLLLEISKLEGRISEMEEKRSYYAFWEVGFGDKGLKSFLLDNVVSTLNERANYYLSYLSDGKIKVEMSTRTKLKSNEYREKFDVRVYSTKGLQEYRGSSGGEKRRADLAMLLALRDIAKSRLNRTFDLLLVDEVFDVLDASGIERVVHLLNQKEQESVFVISHDESLMNFFEHIIVVKKTNGISRIENS